MIQLIISPKYLDTIMKNQIVINTCPASNICLTDNASKEFKRIFTS